MALTTINTSWSYGSYLGDRNKLIKVGENAPLEDNQPGNLGLTFDSVQRPVIGYGYDLKANSPTTLAPYLAAGIVISAYQIEVLNAYNGSRAVSGGALNGQVPSQANVDSVWSNVTLSSEAAATELLNITAKKFEDMLDASFGESESSRVQLPNSRERAAIVSLIYTLGSPASIPTTMNLIRNYGDDPTQRAEIWYQIRYQSNLDTQHTNRRIAESDLFGLYANHSGPATDKEAMAVLYAVNLHKSQISAYESNRQMNSSQKVATQSAPAKDKLINTYGQSRNIANIIIGADGEYRFSVQSEEDNISGGEITSGNQLIFTQSGNDVVLSGDGDDAIYGGLGDDILNGGAGDDYLNGHTTDSSNTDDDASDTLFGGIGNDTLVGGKGADLLKGGANNDTYIYSSGDGHDYIEDYEGGNLLKINGNALGTFVQKSAGSQTYVRSDGAVATKSIAAPSGAYSVSLRLPDGSLLDIAGWSEQNDFGISLQDKPSDPDGGFGSGQKFTRRDPLVLDLDGDGLETVGTAQGVMFDHTGSGQKTLSGWVLPDDGFLVWDKNGNGVIDSGRELFGDAFIKNNGQLATDGFDALGDMDSNQDGKFSSLDTKWSSVRIWRDINQDGISQSTELFTLANRSIQSISTARTPNSQILQNGNQIADTGSFTRTDGSTRTFGEVNNLADINLAQETYYTQFPDSIPISSDVIALPNISGSGQVRELKQAASLNTVSGDTLQTELALYSGLTTRSAQKAAIGNLLLAWANTSNLVGKMEDRNPAQVSVVWAKPAQKAEWESKLHVLEAFYGRYFFTLPGEGAVGAVSGLTIGAPDGSGHRTATVNFATGQLALLQKSYDALANRIYDGLLLQTRLKPYVDSITSSFDVNTGFTMSFAALDARLDSAKLADPVNAYSDLFDLIRVTGSSLAASGWSGFSKTRSWAEQATGNTTLETLLKAMGVKLAGGAISGTQNIDILLGQAAADKLTGFGGNDWLGGGGGNDSLFGDAGNDVLEGGAGNDYLDGGAGDDVYIWGAGDGQDTVARGDAAAGTIDMVRFKSGLSKSNFSVSRYQANDDLTLATSGGLDSLVLQGFFLDDDPEKAPVRFEFADGTSWNQREVMAVYFSGTSGNDWIVGTSYSESLSGGNGVDTLEGRAGDDVIIGGADNDTLNGGTGKDTYVFGATDGMDTLSDTSGLTVLAFNGLSDMSQMKRVFTSSQAIIQYGSGTKVTMSLDSWSRIISITNNGTAISSAAISMDSPGLQYGTAMIEFFVGGAGADSFYAGAGNDVMDGAAGSDFLSGDAGSDTYIFKTGYGWDAIKDLGVEGDLDLVLMDVLPGDVEVSRLSTSSNIFITIKNTNDSLQIVNFFDASGAYQVEKIRFNNASEWGVETLKSKAIEGNDQHQYLFGYASDDVIHGLGGNDTIYGNEGNDWLDGGDGVDIIYGGSGNDFIRGGAGELNRLYGGGGDDVLDGSAEGSAGDTLYGEQGSDTYLFGFGGGGDRLVDTDLDMNNKDVIQLANGVRPEDVVFTRSSSGMDLTLKIGRWDSVFMPYFFRNDANDADGYDRIEEIRFADGTVWTVAMIKSMLVAGNEGSQTIVGYGSDDTISALGGTDYIYGRDGNDVIDGGTDDDYMAGGIGNDTFFVDNSGDVIYEDNDEGVDTVFSSISYSLAANVENLILIGSEAINGTGNSGSNLLQGNVANNTLIGAAGNDTYIFGRGDGQDTISENDATTGNVDQIIFKAGVLPGDIIATNVGGNLVLSIAGTADKITVLSHFTNSRYQIEKVIFGDGSIWTVTDIANAVISAIQTGTAAGNTLTGTAGNDLLDGLAGADVLLGSGGNDRLQGGADNDTLNGGAGNDVLDGGTGIDSLIGGTGDDIYFVDNVGDRVTELAAEGLDVVYSTIGWSLGANLENLMLLDAAGASNGSGNGLANVIVGNKFNNTLDGGGGADVLKGGLGDDVYIVDDGGDQLVEEVGGGIDSVRSSISFSLAGYSQIENLALTGFSAINGAGNSLGNFIHGNVGDNQLDGAEGNDVLEGGAGADILIGGEGVDTASYDHAGDGVWVILDAGDGGIGYAGDAEGDVLQGIENLRGSNYGDELYGSVGANTILGGGGDDTIDGLGGADFLDGGTGVNTLSYTNSGSGVSVNLNSGTCSGGDAEGDIILSFENLNGSDFNDTLIANNGHNIIFGLEGNDFIQGFGGGDFLWGDGGNDTISYEGLNQGVSILLQENGLLNDGVSFYGEWSDSLNSFENVRGTNYNDYIQGSELANIFWGGGGDDLLMGWGGADTLHGGTGDDTYIFDKGNGQDVIVETNSSSAENADWLALSNGIYSDQVWLRHVDNSLEISVIGTTETITIQDWYVGTEHRVEQISADGDKVLLASQVENLVHAMSYFDPPSAGQTTLPPAYQSALASVIAANWH